MVSCQNCGTEVKDDVKFCKNCGSEIVHENSENANKTKFCANCGFKMAENIKFCPSCGAPTSSESRAVVQNTVPANQKSPILAAILSFLIVGLGQIYLGLTKKGILLFIGAVISGFLMLIIIGWITWLIVWGYGIYDAYNSANKINMGIHVNDTIDFNDL